MIAGPAGSGKTPLAAGIGTGLTVRPAEIQRRIVAPIFDGRRRLPQWAKVRYVTVAQLIEALGTDKKDAPGDGRYSIWEAEVLIVDELMDDPAAMRKLADHKNLSKLRHRVGIWVTAGADAEPLQSWIATNATSGGPAETITLRGKPQDVSTPQYTLMPVNLALAGEKLLGKETGKSWKSVLRWPQWQAIAPFAAIFVPMAMALAALGTLLGIGEVRFWRPQDYPWQTWLAAFALAVLLGWAGPVYGWLKQASTGFREYITS